MAEAFRISGAGRLEGARGVRFSFDGQSYRGVEGDTLASALLANGVHLVGRSFKYHRPRGIVSAGAEEPNALVGIRRDRSRQTPNVRATVQELYDGLAAISQNRWPSLAFDAGAVNDLASPLFSAGFYYKTFMWPRAAWERFYEPFIRRAAGLGVAPDRADADCYSNRFAHCDVLVVGAGAAGLAAALAASDAGASVILADEQAETGGALRGEKAALVDGKPAWEWAKEVTETLARRGTVRLLTRTTAFGYYAQNMVALSERRTDHLAEPPTDMPRERLWQVRAAKVILATGAIERPMVFPGNDRPGVMQASAAQCYLNHYGVAAGRRVAVYTAEDSAWQAAFDLKGAGIDVSAIVDCRPSPPDEFVERATALGIECLSGHAVTGTGGRLRVSSLKARRIGGTAIRDVACDALVTSAGWTPSVHLFSQSRGKLVFDAESQRFLPGEGPQDCFSAGSCAGALSLAEAVEQGARAGAAAIGKRRRKPDTTVIEGASWSKGMLGPAGNALDGLFAKAFVDFQNDVTAKDIAQAVREGMRSIEHVKRFTTTGMATDQGKTSNMHGLAIAAGILGKSIPEVGLTTFRAPYTPVTFGALAGHARGALFEPVRRTPIHDWAKAQGAVFEDVGQWKRARYFPRAGEEMHGAVARECRTVRENAGIFDASTLGKIEVTGPDAAAFLEMIYTNPWAKLAVGRCRYGIMLREDGFIFDDGVVGRLGENRFHVTTTTGGAPRVLHHMEDYLQTEFPEMRVYLTSTTEQWAVIAVQGPKSRDIIAPFVEGVDLSDQAMPHMSVREGKVCGVPARIFRMSFTGERGFEINVPADFGRGVWEEIFAEMDNQGGCAYGTEAMHVLRAEKGYIIVGQDTDGTVSPHDAGLAWAIGKSKADFVGMRGLMRPDLVSTGRKQLVGLKTADPKTVLEEGAQIVADANEPVPMTMIGHVTSAYWSENCGRSIALALLKDGASRIGERLFVPMPEGTVEVEVCRPVFFDEEGGRLHG